MAFTAIFLLMTHGTGKTKQLRMLCVLEGDNWTINHTGSIVNHCGRSNDIWMEFTHYISTIRAGCNGLTRNFTNMAGSTFCVMAPFTMAGKTLTVIGPFESWLSQIVGIGWAIMAGFTSQNFSGWIIVVTNRTSISH
jgi:hypothetical protein